MDNQVLEIILRARDEASKVVKDLGSSLDQTSKQAENMSTAFKVAGGIVTGVGIAGVLAMKSWLDAGVQAQTETIKTNTLLGNLASQMSTTSQAVYAHTGTVKENTKAIQDKIAADQLEIKQLQLSGTGHKDQIKTIQTEILAYKEQELALKTNGVAQGALTGYTKASTVTFQQLRDATDAVSAKMLDLGFDAETSSLSFAKLLGATKTVSDAQKAMQVTADLSRFSNISLDDATTAVTRAYEGNTRALKALGIEVPKGAKGMEVLGLLQDRLAGQADNFANSYAGLQARLTASTTELKEKLGTALLPMFDKLADKLGSVITWLNKLDPNVIKTAAMVTLAGTAFALIVGPLLIFIGFLPAIVAGFGTIAAVGLPVVLILAGVAAVAYAAYMAFTHWGQIVSFLNRHLGR